MTRIARLVAGIALVSAGLGAAAASAEEFPKVAPFTGVRWDGDVPQVEVDGAWAVPVTIDGRRVADVLAFARTAYGEKWRKRFAEDLHQVLAEMGKAPGPRVDLELKDEKTGEVRVLRGVPMTKDNRRAVLASSSATAPVPERVPRVSRDHATDVADRWRGLVRRIEGGDVTFVPAARAAEDLDELEWVLENRYSYATRKGFEYRRALDAIRASLESGIPRGAFAVQVAKVLAGFGDGHTRLEESPDSMYGRTSLPFLVAPSGDRLVAFTEDRNELLDDAHPFLASLDGVEVEKWVEAARSVVADASPAFVRHHAVRMLRAVAFVRQELGLPASKDLAVVLESPTGKSRKRVSLPLSDRTPRYGEWPRTASSRPPGGIAYLRIADMDDSPEFVKGILDFLDAAKSAKGLVIDVRGNGGGRRDLLRAMLPRFLPADSPPRVVNVGAYRLGPGEKPDLPEGYLDDRFLWPLTSREWAPAAKTAVGAFASSFRPEWPLPEGVFSAWHYFAIEPAPARAPRFSGRVAILQDAACFSATDVFLSAFQGLPDVTLVGTPSGGGSGRAKGASLSNSRLGFQASSMASFRADGRLYDGKSIDPDVVVEPEPGYFVGKSDKALDEAKARVGKGR